MCMPVTIWCHATPFPQREHFQGNFLTGEGLMRGVRPLHKAG